MTNPDAVPTDPAVALLTRLREVAEAIPYVEKRGTNQHHGYSFAQAVDVTRAVRDKLFERNIILLPGVLPGSLRHFTETGGKGFLTTVDLVYTFACTETGAKVEVPWAAAGADTGGDKGLYKAYTGGLKYALLSLFLLPTSDDPEHDALTQSQATPSSTDADAERPAAPTIPLDRAKSIAEAAIAAGMATWPEGGNLEMEPLLKAKLADVGVSKIGELNVDQAEAVEAFIVQEQGDGVGAHASNGGAA